MGYGLSPNIGRLIESQQQYQYVIFVDLPKGYRAPNKRTHIHKTVVDPYVQNMYGLTMVDANAHRASPCCGNKPWFVHDNTINILIRPSTINSRYPGCQPKNTILFNDETLSVTVS